MDTFLEMQTAVQNDLTIGSESTLYPLTTVKLALNRAYRKAGGLFRWPELEDSKKTSAQSGQDYYDYPDEWQPDSIWKVTIDSVRYGEDPNGAPLSFEDYLIFKEDSPNSTDKKWSSQWRRFFVSPTPTANGTNNICVWGQVVVTPMSVDASTTIFSYSMPECNEAIVLEAVAILKGKGENDSAGQFRSAQAKEILVIAWNKIRQNQSKYHKNQPFLNVPDFYGGSQSKQLTGDFDI